MIRPAGLLLPEALTGGQLKLSRRIGFIGIGLIGRGMARNLIRKEQSVKIYKRGQRCS
ncbi:MAG: hypothetical protein H0W76_21770 [Pyrinomonadaceae bacterium]|nr:hypothetical protein [Pyrinomonadaceae bacterium]